MTELIQSAYAVLKKHDNGTDEHYLATHVIRTESERLTDRIFKAAFRILYRSTKSFHERFGRFPPVAEDQMLCVLEEVGEVKRTLDGDGVLVEEIADTIVTLQSLAMASGITLDELEEAMIKTANKNDAKTHETHAIDDNGKIARR